MVIVYIAFNFNIITQPTGNAVHVSTADPGEVLLVTGSNPGQWSFVVGGRDPTIRFPAGSQLPGSKQATTPKHVCSCLSQQ